MPFVNDDPGFFTYEPDYSPPEPKNLGWGETVDAAFRLENDVVNAYEWLTQPVFANDPTYDIAGDLKQKGLWEQRDSYIGSRSAAQTDWITSKRQQEQTDKETLASAGMGGIAAAVAAGILSPTILLPLIGPEARGLQAVRQGALFVGLGAGLQEGVLYANQETRTAGEAAFSLGASVVLGGILGGAAGMLKRGEFERIASDMADERRSTYGAQLIPNSTEASNLSAAVPYESAGGLKPGAANKLAFIGPVTRGIAQDESSQLRYFTSRFADAGVQFEGNSAGIAASPGGNVENMIKTYHTRVATMVKAGDELYADYFFGAGQGPGFARNLRATVGGMFDKNKLNKEQFLQEAGRATWNNDISLIPEAAELAKRMRAEVYEPLWKEGEEVGLWKHLEIDKDEMIKLVGDPTYGMRVYNTEVINSRWNEFVSIIAGNVKTKLEKQFAEAYAKLTQSQKKDDELIEDLSVSEEIADSLKAKWTEDLSTLERASPEHLKIVEEDIAMLRSQRRKIDPNTTGGREARDSLDKEIAELTKFGGDALPKMKEVRGNIKRRLRNLEKSRVMLSRKQQAKLDRIEAIEDRALTSMNRAVRAAQRFLKAIDSYSDEEFAKQVKKVKNLFADAAETFDKGETRLTKMIEGDAEAGDLLAQEALQQSRSARMSRLAEQIAELDTTDPAAWREGLQMGLDEMLEGAADLNMRRGARRARLQEQAKTLDPKQVENRIREVQEGITARRANFKERFGTTADDIDLDTGTADFARFSREQAEETGHAIRATDRRVPFNDIIQDERGPRLARTLDIPSHLLGDFLETNIEKITRMYVRSMAADISMARVFGSANAKEEFAKLLDEQNARLAAVEKAVDKKGNPLSAEAKERETARIMKFYDDARNDMNALIERARGIRGIPKDPAGAAARMARTAMNLNVLRLMGGVTISSISDPARIIQKYGLTRTFRDGFLPFITNMKLAKITAREAKLAGAALDPITHSRAHSMYDVFDDFQRGGKLEKGIEFLTNKMGLIAGFDYWTSAWKQVASNVIVAQMMDSIDLVLHGKGSKAEIDKAIEFLASSNLSRRDMEIIWEQTSNGVGGAKVNGVWMPNTESWNVADPNVMNTLRTFRTALVGHIDNTIVTPGFERPLWMDATIAGRLLGQFKSFGMSSTTKTMMAGLQQRDMAYVNGTMISLALGAVSYYLWAMSVGGEAKTEMLNAGLDKWADEAITRSGQTAVFDELSRIFQKIPATAPYTTFSGTRSSRREGGDLSEALLGPTFDLLEKTGGILMGADDPTQHTAHLLRQILPFQNMSFFRQALDAIEAASGLPERRE